MGKNLLYLRRSYKKPSPKEDSHLVYVLVVENLKAAALDAINALIRVNELGQYCGSEISSLLVRYRSGTLADKKAQSLRDLDLQKNHSVQRNPSDTAFRDLIVGSGDTLQIHYSTFLANEPDLNDLFDGILGIQVGRVFTLCRRQKQLAKKYCSIFRPSDIVEIDSMLEIPPTDRRHEVAEFAEAMVFAHRKVGAFLRLLLNQCTDSRPADTTVPAKTHAFRIDKDMNFAVDGVQIRLNEAKRASILTLAILGTDKVGLADFAEHYCRLPIHNRTVNLPNIFAKAIRWLLDVAPSLSIKKPSIGTRQLVGVKIESECGVAAMRNFLNERRENLDSE